MPVLARVTKQLTRDKTLKGQRIAMCLHLEAKTAVLAQIIHTAGATVAVTGSNPLSTQDDVAAALAEAGVEVHAWRGLTDKEHQANLARILAIRPDILIDDGAELTINAHRSRTLLRSITGACEETTTGVTRLKAMERQRRLRF